ncbi:MAG: hypothetical protein MSQ05_09265, partial [Akkermansia sp.]|nr:hypothetical protein [Akkermansia sp.]
SNVLSRALLTSDRPHITLGDTLIECLKKDLSQKHKTLRGCQSARQGTTPTEEIPARRDTRES